MIIDFLREWGGLLFATLNLLLVWVIWSLGRRFASKEDLVPINRRLDQCEKQMEITQRNLSYQPGRREIEALRVATTTLEVKIARMEATMRKLDETARRLSDYLLNQRSS